jgi:hypothetical protein
MTCETVQGGQTRSTPENQFRYTIQREFNKNTNKFEDNSITITEYMGNSKAVIIPGTIKGLPVTEIAKGAFANLGLTEVTLPENIKQIMSDAFSGNDITSLVIPSSIINIFEGAFINNPLKSITMPDHSALSDENFSYDLAKYYCANGQQAGTYIKQDEKVLYNGAAIPEPAKLWPLGGALMTELDDKSYGLFEKNTGSFYYLPPGKHTLKIMFFSWAADAAAAGSNAYERSAEITEDYTFESGKTYTIRTNRIDNRVSFEITEGNP